MSRLFKGRVVLAKETSDSWYSRGYFPHFDGEGVTQHVCFHLFDSLPQSLLPQWREKLRGTHAAGVLDLSEASREWRRRIHDALDGPWSRRWRLRLPIVEDALLHLT
jgi:hypothetical protein